MGKWKDKSSSMEYEEVFPHVYRHKDTGEIYTDIEPRAIE